MVRTIRIFSSYPASLLVALVFMAESFLLGTWVARIPDVKQYLGLSAGALGWALLGASIGALAMMPFATRLTKQFGTGRSLLYGTWLLCLSIAMPALAVDALTLGLALFLVGFATGWLNVAMNAAATAVEDSYGLRIMAACHGLFSLGGMLGALLASPLAGIGFPYWLHLPLFGLLLALGLLFAQRHYLGLPEGPAEQGAFSWPGRRLAGLVFIGFAIMLIEGAIADWSAVYIQDSLGGRPFTAGLGFAAFCLSMALGRFYGDGLLEAWGERRVLLSGTALGSLGLALTALAPHPLLAILGFALVGLGLSCVVPTLFGAAARLAPGQGIAAIATAGVLGFLIGPPAIGAIAEWTGLGTALLGLAALGGLALAVAGLRRA